MQAHSNLDGQPEPDESPAMIASLSMGLVLATGLIIGAMLGALLGHLFLDDAFGWHQDILVGAVIGAVVLATLGILFVRTLTARVARHEQMHSHTG